MHVVLVGPMGVGKSTVSRLLADRLGRPQRDSDDDLRAERGITGRDLAAAEGVAALHRWEAAQLLRALGDPTASVIAAAASVVDDAACREALGAAFVVWLRARPETLAARVRRSCGAAGSPDHRRPLEGDPTRAMARLSAERAGAYGRVADVAIDVDDAGPEQAVADIMAALPEGVT